MTAVATRAHEEVRASQTSELFERAKDAGEAERRLLLAEVVVLNMRVAENLVWRYRSRGIAIEDLRQVAYLALTKSTRRFDPDAGHDFLAFCVPTIRGELRKHFRDQAWMVRPPRRLQELRPEVAAANAQLWQSLGRSPRASEVAHHIGQTEEAVLEVLGTEGCFHPASLDKTGDGDAAGDSLGDLLASPDTDQESVEARMMLEPLLRDMAGRDRRILQLRFVDGLTQREIAAEIGVTQMQVSRLLTRICRELREALGAEADPAA